jgi:hypothetical protein
MSLMLQLYRRRPYLQEFRWAAGQHALARNPATEPYGPVPRPPFALPQSELCGSDIRVQEMLYQRLSHA